MRAYSVKCRGSDGGPSAETPPWSLRGGVLLFAATAVRMPIGTKIIVFCLYLTAAVLLINAIGVPRPGAALYNLSVTFHQATNIVAYVYALKFILDEAAPPGVVIPKPRADEVIE